MVTPLGRRSFPLIRFNTKDLVVKGKSSCSCGRTSQKIGEVVGRIDDLRKIRGVLFSPKTVEEVIRQQFQEVEEFEIVVERRGSYGCDLAQSRGQSSASARIYRRDESQTCVRASRSQPTCPLIVIMEPPGSLPRYTLKAKRFKDLREETSDGNDQERDRKD